MTLTIVILAINDNEDAQQENNFLSAAGFEPGTSENASLSHLLHQPFGLTSSIMVYNKAPIVSNFGQPLE